MGNKITIQEYTAEKMICQAAKRHDRSRLMHRAARPGKIKTLSATFVDGTFGGHSTPVLC